MLQSEASWVAPTIGLIASLTLLALGAHVLIRRESTSSLFSKDEAGLLIAKAAIGALIAMAGITAFFRSLVILLRG